MEDINLDYKTFGGPLDPCILFHVLSVQYQTACHTIFLSMSGKFLCHVALIQHVPPWIGDKVMSSHVVPSALIVMMLSNQASTARFAKYCLHNKWKKAPSVLCVSHIGCSQKITGLSAWWHLSSLTSPLYSPVCLSVNMSDGIRLKGCIRRLCC